MRMPNRPNYAQIYADSEISFLYNNEDNIAYEKEINHLAAEIQQMNDEKMKKLLRLRELTDRLLRGLNYLDIE